MFWAKDGEELDDNVDHGELLSNHDGTFQISADLNVSSIKHEDWKHYSCVFQLSGLQEDIHIRLDPNLIRTNYKKPDHDGRHETHVVTVRRCLSPLMSLILESRDKTCPL